ncbi:hypothetical protein L1987_00897 [Smallanthus sonchifolius]|uniref:Uncharacterized protein n=1 Tax=Smallanthus sonchifolius TaxID=185202 RepID=A0ACB9K3K7_9ASTR|nr:hypothetical protein L1987_00897 [Smallanthus sonchifolius]
MHGRAMPCTAVQTLSCSPRVQYTVPCTPFDSRGDTVISRKIQVNGLIYQLPSVFLLPLLQAWLNSLPTGSITTWDDLAQKFPSKYFPPAKTAKLRNDITTFTQDDGESLYEAWERFKNMLRKCPHHGLEVWLQVSSFYNGLHNQAR